MDIVKLVTAIIAGLAFGFSIYNFAKTRAATFYSDIDARYLELLKLGIANPDFVNPVLTNNYTTHFSGDRLRAYEQYAFAAWNIVETVFDRSGKLWIVEKIRGEKHWLSNNIVEKVFNGSRKDLRETWHPVMIEENRLHRMWLNDEKNRHKFKKKFWTFIIGNKDFFPCPECKKLQQQGEDKPLCKRCQDLDKQVKSKGKYIPLSPVHSTIVEAPSGSIRSYWT